MTRLDALYARFGQEQSECTANITEARAVLTMIDSRYSETAAYVQRVAPLGGPVPFPEATASLYGRWATALAMSGRNVEARKVYAAAVRLVPRLGTRSAMLTLRSTAAQAQDDGDWDLAEGMLDRALQLVRNSVEVSPAYINVTQGRLLGNKTSLFQQKLSETASVVARRQLALRIVATADTSLRLLRAHRTDNPDEQEFDRGRRAFVLINVAYADAVLGEHRRAEQHLNEAYALLSPVAQQMLPQLSFSYWLTRSETQQMAGRLADAAQSARLSLEACMPRESLICQTSATEQMAVVAEASARTEDAERLYRSAAEMRDAEWEQMRFKDWSAASFARVRTTYQGLARVLVQGGKPHEALSVLDGARARALRDVRVRQRARTRVGEVQQGRIDSMLTIVHAQRIRLSEFTLLPEERALLQDSVSRVQDQIDAVVGYSVETPAALDLPKLQRVLGAQRRTLVSYLVGPDSTLAFLVTADTLIVRTLPIGEGRIEQEMRAAGGAWAAAGTDPAIALGPLNRLYDALIAPIAGHIRDGDGLVVIPDGPLADLPFGMLVEAPAQDYASARFLVRSRAVSTDLAASLIVEDAARPELPFDLDLVAFGRSRFDGSGGGTFRGRSGPLLANLPYVVGEIERVGARVRNREAVMNDEATETEFNATAGRARIVHIASHAEADPEYPLNSRIYLWDGPGSDDGVVHLFELQDLMLPADLVVLSGCSTAAGQAQPGEGTIGLQYGVRAAGAGATLATLWPVDDRATAEIVDAFYAGLAEGLPKDRALQQAQVQYLDAHAGTEASPYLWAATVLSGSPASVPIRAPRPVWPWLAGTLALGVGGLAWWARRRLTHA